MKWSLIFVVSILVIDACVSRLEIDNVDQQTGTLVVEGQITDAPGPYQVKLFRSTTNVDNLNSITYLLAKSVTIFDDVGQSEELKSNKLGVYETNPSGIRGQIGRKYAIRIQMLDGTIFESTPDELKATGQIDAIRFEWQSIPQLDGPAKNGFKVFMDSQATNSFVRWRFTGSYMLEAFPQLRRLNGASCANGPPPPPPDPPECSGWRYNFISRFNPFAGGTLEEFGECTCCLCWVSVNETRPSLSEDIISTNGTYQNIEIGFIPFDQWTFGRGKYMVKVEQMSLTEQAFEFWKLIKDQKEGTGSLFQPAVGKTKTNLFSTNSNLLVMGIFYASSVSKQINFLTGKDAPIAVPEYNIKPSDNCTLWHACEELSSFTASRNPPPEWE